MSNRASLYTIEDGKLIRKNETCPKCGPGVFLANHPDRKSCGRCGYNPIVIPAPTVGAAKVAPAVVVEEVVEEVAEVADAPAEVESEDATEAEADTTEPEAEAEAEADTTEPEAEAEADAGDSKEE